MCLYSISYTEKLNIFYSKNLVFQKKKRKKYIKAACCHPVYLTYIQTTLCEVPGWMKHKLESRLPAEISITSDMQIIPPLWQKVNRN